MTSAGLLVLAAFLCTFVEWIQERFFGAIEALKGYPMVLLSAAIGVALCFGFSIDLLTLVGFEGDYMPWIGKVISGLIIGSGSNALHKFFKPSSKR